MKNHLLAVACLMAAHLPLMAEDASASLLPNASFENEWNGRPKGWNIFTTPSDAPGEFYLSGEEGKSHAHSGEHALQFYFPEGANIAQCLWIADPKYGGMPVEPGLYTCTFKIKGIDMQPGFHVWVSAVGFDADGKRVDKTQRSEYLKDRDLETEKWIESQFFFEVRPQDGIKTIAPVVVFKTSPDGGVNSVPPGTRILIDDVVIKQDKL